MRLLAFCILLIPTLLAAVELERQSPPQAEAIPTDAAVHWGTLSNGLPYSIMPNAEPAGKVSIRLLVMVGSRYETEAELGMAHFLEHLAFKGGDHYPDNTLIDKLQEMGIQHGSHSNAHTGFDETVYKLDLPDTKTETFTAGMLWFQDVLGGLHLKEEMVLPERGVILAEMRDRDSAGLRMAKVSYETMYAGRTFPTRFPIGTEEIVSTTTGDQLRAFWKKWYRTDNAFLAISGDIEAKALLPILESTIGKVPAPTEPLIEIDRGSLKATGFASFANSDVEARSDTLRLNIMAEEVPPADSAATRLQDFYTSMAAEIVNRRLSRLAEDGQSPILGGGIGGYHWMDIRHGAASVTIREGRTQEAVHMIEQELRRFLLHGATTAEIEQAITRRQQAMDRAIARKANRPSRGLAEAMYQAFKYQTVFMSPEQSKAFMTPWLSDITSDKLVAALQHYYQDAATFVMISGRDVDDLADDVGAWWKESAQKPVEPWTLGGSDTWPYAIPAAASVAAQQTTLQHGITSLAWSNNIRAAVLARDAKENEVLFRVQVSIDKPTTVPGLRSLASASFLGRGTVRLSRSELNDLLDSTSIRVSASVGDHAVILNGSCLPKDLPQALEYTRALLDDPAWRLAPIERSRQAALEGLRGTQNDLSTQAGRLFTGLLVDNDPHRRSATLTEMEALSPDVVEGWLAPILAQGAIEVAIVGDIETEKAIAASNLVFGSMEPRQPLRVVEDLAAADALQQAPAIPTGLHELAVDGTVARGVALIAWPTVDAADVKLMRRLGLLGSILRNRLRDRLREDMGDAYSPGARHTASDIYDNFGYMQVNVAVAPDRLPVAHKAIREEILAIADGGLTAMNLTHVLTPAVKSLATYRDTNGYWLGSVMARCHSQPQRLEWANSMIDDFNSIELAEIQALAKQYLSESPLTILAISEGDKDADAK